MQQKIMMFLPLLFLFMFARFPAGLVVYWTWNNVLSIAQQWLIMRRMGITRASLAADAAKIKKIKEQAAAGTLPQPSRSRPSTSRKKKRPAGERGTGGGRAKSASRRRSPDAEPKRKKSYREQAGELRREKIRQKKRKLQERDAKKRAKKRGDGKRKNSPAAEAAPEKEEKLSRRQRRAAKAEQAGSAAQGKSESGEWEKDNKRPSRRAKGRKPTPRR